jgi:hypothetical protein
MSAYDAAIFDFYDDFGTLLKKAVPDPEEVPDFVKMASMMRQEDNSQLFALVLVDDGRVLKKYATVDRGNTWLSTLYFAHTKDSLPLDAQKVAAANLIEACEAFEIDPPEVLWKTAEGPVDGNLVDVTAKQPAVQVADEREEIIYAIERADGSKHYPLKNDAVSVKVADDYFQRNSGEFVPRERREFAVKVASIAGPAGWPLSSEISHYASKTYNPTLEGHLTDRYLHLVNKDADPEVRDALMKLATAQQGLEPEAFAERLEAFDRENGLDQLWDRWVSDPWYSTFGMSKIAKGSAIPGKTFTVGEVTVTQDELESLAVRSIRSLQETFGQPFTTAFCKDPVAQFEALPLPQRKFVARMATTLAEDPVG